MNRTALKLIACMLLVVLPGQLWAEGVKNCTVVALHQVKEHLIRRISPANVEHRAAFGRVMEETIDFMLLDRAARLTRRQRRSLEQTLSQIRLERSLGSNTLGLYRPAGRTVHVLDGPGHEALLEMISTLVHEVEHAIDFLENYRDFADPALVEGVAHSAQWDHLQRLFDRIPLDDLIVSASSIEGADDTIRGLREATRDARVRWEGEGRPGHFLEFMARAVPTDNASEAIYNIAASGINRLRDMGLGQSQSEYVASRLAARANEFAADRNSDDLLRARTVHLLIVGWGVLGLLALQEASAP